MSVILMTTLFYKALILQGEIWCWSLLGLKGLTKKSYEWIFINKFLQIIDTALSNVSVTLLD